MDHASAEMVKGSTAALEGINVRGVVNTVADGDAHRLDWIMGTRPARRSGEYVIARAGHTFEYDYLQISDLDPSRYQQSRTDAMWRGCTEREMADTPVCLSYLT